MDKFVVTNPATAITGWTLEFDLPAGVTMGNFYNGTATQTGSTSRVVNAHYNGTVAAGCHHRALQPVVHRLRRRRGAAQLPDQRQQVRRQRRPRPERAGRAGRDRADHQDRVVWRGPPRRPPTSRSPATTCYAGGAVVARSPGPAAVVTGLTPNTTYTFTVRAKDTRGNASAASAAGQRDHAQPGQRHHRRRPCPANLRSTAKTAVR